MQININGIDAIISFSFTSKNNLLYKTFITQEMLKRGILASNLIYLSIDHNKKIIDHYIKNLDNIFKLISKNSSKNKILKKIKGPVCHGTFQRLND